MENNIIAIVPFGATSLIVWFENGVSKLFDAATLGITSSEQNARASITDDGASVTWNESVSISADELFKQGSTFDFVTNEKKRLLKELASIRRDSSLSQTRLGEAAGIRQSVISRIEGCEISPQINTLLKLLAPMGKTLAIVDINDSQ
ncbi:MAG: helix-turn-helix domain-containing protein [Coriobacteriales bacterium]|nr:helix-turn-helix domain-containing protein [Coriobacteriales bacterium]